MLANRISLPPRELCGIVVLAGSPTGSLPASQEGLLAGPFTMPPPAFWKVVVLTPNRRAFGGVSDNGRAVGTTII